MSEKPIHYLVQNKVFETLEEAGAYADDYFEATRIVLAITATHRKITHIYHLGGSENE